MLIYLIFESQQVLSFFFYEKQKTQFKLENFLDNRTFIQ